MAKRVLLGVNVDHCATVRQARYRDYAEVCGGPVEPDPVAFALLCEEVGADGITMHLREDRRHIRDSDVWRLRASMHTRLNLEMACTDAMTAFALELKPDSVCLVPEGREEVTTEGGLDVAGQGDRVGKVVAAMRRAGIATSLFIDPTAEQVRAAAELGSPWVELHTGAFANAFYESGGDGELGALREAAELAHSAGLTVNAGHGINYTNVARIREIPHLHELNIGHSIVSRALFFGVGEAVGTMREHLA